MTIESERLRAMQDAQKTLDEAQDKLAAVAVLFIIGNRLQLAMSVLRALQTLAEIK